MPPKGFTKESAAAARAKLQDARTAIRASACSSCQANPATITNGLGRGTCATCNRTRLRDLNRSKKELAAIRGPLKVEPTEETPTEPRPKAPARGKAQTKRKPRKRAQEVAPEEKAPPTPKAPSAARERVGGILRRALNTSISGKYDDD